jgi:flagella basal body P-ring formation protein FlgA
MEKPMGRCEGIVVSARQNISANRTLIGRHFEAPTHRPRIYSGRMTGWPARSPSRTSPRRTSAWCISAWCTSASCISASCMSDRRPPGHRGVRTALSVARAVCVGLVCVAAALAPALAAEPAPPHDTALDQQVRQLALQAVRPGAVGAARVEVTLGALDPRLKLAPCDKVEPYLPNNLRLWGKTRIGLRCTRGPSAWNVYLPITVKAWGSALVARAALPAGSVLTASDLAQAEIDLAEDPSMALTDLAPAVGRTLLYALQPGQSVRQAHLKPRQWFAAGDAVQVLARGAGFSAASSGEALTAGIEGQSARVRVEGGRVLVGQPVAENRMELAL